MRSEEEDGEEDVIDLDGGAPSSIETFSSRGAQARGICRRRPPRDARPKKQFGGAGQALQAAPGVFSRDRHQLPRRLDHALVATNPSIDHFCQGNQPLAPRVTATTARHRAGAGTDGRPLATPAPPRRTRATSSAAAPACASRSSSGRTNRELR